MNIAIAISVHNRHETAAKTVSEWRKRLPKGAKLFIVDDGSDMPFEGADFRFEVSQGIAGCKNKCLHLCEDADYIFLADDDIYPIVDDWHLPYINSGEKHLCLTFNKFSNGKPNGRIILKTENGINHYKEPCGVLLFLTKEVLKSVGGMDETYGKWGFEHLNYSVRIHNLGFTKYPFMDVVNSIDMFYSYDHQQTITRSVDPKIRAQLARTNERKYRQEIKSKAFIPYKKINSYVITTYFTGVVDPQRGVKYEADLSKISPLFLSVHKQGFKTIILNDCFDENDNQFYKSVKYPATINPYFQRWYTIHDYLINHPEIDQVFCVDATDVEMQINPFMEMQKGFLYVGDEAGNRVKNEWLIKHHNNPIYSSFRTTYAQYPLLNMGIVGGFRDDVIEFCNLMTAYYDTVKDTDMTDMCLGNYICYEKICYSRIKHGSKINTRFKANERNNISYFKHK